MHTKQVAPNIYLIDLETCSFKNLIASYAIKAPKPMLIETGPTSSVPKILSALKEIGIKEADVAYIGLTHIHLDHGGGAGTLLKSLPNAKLVVHSKGQPHLVDPAKLWKASKDTLDWAADMFGKPEPVPANRIVVAEEGSTLDLGEGVSLRVIQTPGHAAHDLAFYEEHSGGLFVGDAAGAFFEEYHAIVYPTTPPPFRPDVALVTLEKLISQNPKIIFYSHFGASLHAVKRLRDYAIQIKRWLNIVQEGVKAGLSDEAIRESVFEQDESIRGVVPMLKAHEFHRKTLICNSVDGFISFVKNPQI